jgi:ABC-type lipoprotein release transport system permease subunit
MIVSYTRFILLLRTNIIFVLQGADIAHCTPQRTQEMAIRLALGSQRPSVIRLILLALVASATPAYRAGSIELIEALRAE